MANWLDSAEEINPTNPAVPPEKEKPGDWVNSATPVEPAQPVEQKPAVAPVTAAPEWTSQARVLDPTPPPPAQDPEYLKVRKIIERPVLDANIIGTEITTDAELEAIARHHGVNPDDLKKASEFYGARRTEADVPSLGRISGALGRAVGNIPQFIAKKTQEDVNYRKALDDVRELADKKRSWGEFVAENIVPVGLAGKAIRGVTEGASLAAKALSHGARGATYGLAGSREGEEVPSTLIGAGAGAALGVGADKVGQVLTKRAASKAGQKTAQIAPGEIDTTVRTLQADVGKAVDQKMAQRTESEARIFDRVVSKNTSPIADTEADLIIKQQLGPEKAQIFMSPSTPEGRVLRRSMDDLGEPVSNEAVKQRLAQDIVDDRTRSFARELAGSDTTPKLEDARKIISKALERNPQLSEQYKDHVLTQAAKDSIEEYGLRSTGQPGFVGRMFEFFSPNEYVARHVDDKYGRNIEKILRDGSNEFNQSTYMLSKFRNQNDQLSDLADRLGIGDELRQNPGKIYEALNSGDLSRLSPQEQKFARGFQQIVESYRQDMNSTGKINIPQLKNYVPKAAKQTSEIIPVVENKIDQALADANKLTGRQIDDIGQLSNLELTQLEQTSPALRDLINYRGFISGEGQRGMTAGELSGFLKESLYSSNGRRALELRANAALERSGGEIPSWMVEQNPFKLLDKWSMNTVRGAYLGPTLNKLRNEVSILRKLGADVDAATIEKMGADLLGPRKGTAAQASAYLKTEYQRHIDKLVDAAGGKRTLTGAFLDKLRVAPEVMNSALSQIYPNVLGANPASLVTNLGGNYVKMVPELGAGAYATKLATEATAKNIANFGKNLQAAKLLGNVPAEFVRNQNRAIAEGIQRTGLYKAGSRATDAVNKLSMYLFQKTEEFNRGTAIELAKQLTRDLTEGSKGAVGVVNNMPRSLRLFIAQNIKTRPNAVGVELAKYFNNVIAQNYNKLSASEFARTAGPLFSAFTKWPSVALGQATYEMRRRGIPGGLRRNMQLIGTPWLVLQAIDHASGERRDRDEDTRSDRLKEFVGQEGVSKLAPSGALKSFGTGEFFTPPAVGVAKKFGQSVADPNADLPQTLKKTGGEITRNFVPGAGLLRFVSRDLATLKTGEKPEGENFFEQTQEGLKQLGK